MATTDSKLTAKQQLFVKHYLVTLNATQAAIKAGYSEKCAGSQGEENMNKPAIMKAINKAMDKRAKKLDITADSVLKMITESTQALVDEGKHDKAFKGMELLGKHLKLFTDKVELSSDPVNPLQLIMTNLQNKPINKD